MPYSATPERLREWAQKRRKREHVLDTLTKWGQGGYVYVEDPKANVPLIKLFPSGPLSPGGPHPDIEVEVYYYMHAEKWSIKGRRPRYEVDSLEHMMRVVAPWTIHDAPPKSEIFLGVVRRSWYRQLARRYMRESEAYFDRLGVELPQHLRLYRERLREEDASNEAQIQTGSAGVAQSAVAADANTVVPPDPDSERLNDTPARNTGRAASSATVEDASSDAPVGGLLQDGSEGDSGPDSYAAVVALCGRLRDEGSLREDGAPSWRLHLTTGTGKADTDAIRILAGVASMYRDPDGSHPAISNAELAEMTGRSERHARRVLARLVDHGVVRLSYQQDGRPGPNSEGGTTRWVELVPERLAEITYRVRVVPATGDLVVDANPQS